MNTLVFLALLSVPAWLALGILALAWLFDRTQPPARSQRWRLNLMLGAVLLLLMPLVVFARDTDLAGGSLLLVLFLPTASGLLGALPLEREALQSAWLSERHVMIPLLGALIVLLLLIGLRAPLLLLWLLAIPVLLSLLWRVGQRLAFPTLAALSLLAGAWLISGLQGSLQRSLFGSGNLYSAALYQALATLTSLLAFGLAALLVQRAAAAPTRPARWQPLALALLLFLSAAANLFSSGRLLQAQGMAMVSRVPFAELSLAVASGLVLGLALHGDRRLWSAAFLLLATTLLLAGYALSG